MTFNNQQVFFAQECKQSIPVPGEHLQVRGSNIDLDAPLADGAYIVKHLYFSIDPYFRHGLANFPPNIWGFQLGEVVRGVALGVVSRSSNPKYPQGAIVISQFAKGLFSEYSIIQGSEQEHYQVLLEDGKASKVPVTNYLGVLGVAGMTGYYGLFEHGKPKAGETIFISGAAGGVGQLVGQLAKLQGLHVVGSAGTDEKVAYLKEIGYDGAFNYKKSDMGAKLAELCPNGIDLVFENVGGDSLNAAIAHCNNWARIVMCGTSGHKANGGAVPNLSMMMPKRLRMQAINAHDISPEMKNEFTHQVTEWLVQGKIQYREYITEGIENTPKAVADMLVGENLGKAIVKVADL